jgi:3-phenylpropionate/trans-cinnamate dioxygenase ferredoxin component
VSQQVLIPAHKLPAAGSRSIVREGGLSLAVFSVEGALYAVDDSCPHSGASLVMGKLDGFRVRCPAHGLQFDIRNGCMSTPGGMAVQAYPVMQVNGQTFVTVPDPSHPSP